MDYNKTDFTNLIWITCEADSTHPYFSEFREKYTLSDMLMFYEVSNG